MGRRSPRALAPIVLVVVLLVLIISGILISAAHSVPLRRPGIVGGAPVSIASAPWQAYVDDGRGGRCSASLVASRWLLTAAHCVAGVRPSQVRVLMGENRLTGMPDSRYRDIDRIVIHPQWRSQEAVADLALLRLSRTPDSPAMPIALPQGQDAAAWPARGTAATVSGWGLTRRGGRASDVLRQASVTVLGGPGDPRCGMYGDAFIPDAHVCAGRVRGGADACAGDSGGALVTLVAGRPVLVGVASAGNGCGRSAYPGVYARVTTYAPWITSTTTGP